MLQNGYKTIGIFISDVFSEFQRELCRGITEQGQIMGYNTLFFTCFGVYNQENDGTGEMNIVELPDFKKLDGIIYAPSTYAVNGQEHRIIDRIKSEATCPVVTIVEDTGIYGCVQIDNEHVLEELIEHFINVHQFTRINFISGPQSSVTANKRLDCYMRIMNKYGLYDEKRIYYGDFWREKASDAVEEFLTNGTLPPQAIVCANDCMAVTACIALAKRGINVPLDIAISGCDNTELSANFIPTITTINIPALSMGLEAVKKINRYHTNEPDNRISYVDTSCLYRESCGCKKMNSFELGASRKQLLESMEEESEGSKNNMFMSIDLQSLLSLQELFSMVENHFVRHFRTQEFYLCLSENWKSRNRETTSYGFSDKIMMVLGIHQTNRLERQEFSKDELLPAVLMQDAPLSYYFVSTHYQSRCYGYAVLKFKEGYHFPSWCQSFLINISNAIENFCVKEELQQVAAELKDMYVHDVLTGLYNRRGFQVLGKDRIDQGKKLGQQIFVLGADVDDLKVINDTYGHSAGDIAIQTVANALAAAANHSEICARCGGDEFSVIGIDYNEMKAMEFVRCFVDTLELYNRSKKYPYRISASWGIELTYVSETMMLEDILNEADKKMYENKRRGKQNKMSRVV